MSLNISAGAGAGISHRSTSDVRRNSTGQRRHNESVVLHTRLAARRKREIRVQLVSGVARPTGSGNPRFVRRDSATRLERQAESTENGLRQNTSAEQSAAGTRQSSSTPRRHGLVTWSRYSRVLN